MNKRSIFALTATLTLALPGSSSQAGETVVGPEPLLSGCVSVGYDTAYLFRGGNYGDDAPWAGADFNLPVRDSMLLNFGVWYVNPTGGNSIISDELDVYSYLVVPVGADWELAVGGTWFYFPEDDADRGELGVTLSRSLFDFADFTFEYVYDLDAEGNYFGYYLDKIIPLNQVLDLNLGAGISHADEQYNRGVLGGDHAYTQAGLTYHFSESVDMNAYVLGNYPYNDLQALGEDRDIYGGVSMSVCF